MGLFCGRCGSKHQDLAHESSALCCAGIRLHSGNAPDECPPEHAYCPNCKTKGHGPPDRINCKFWQHSSEKKWIENHSARAESVKDQLARKKKELDSIKKTLKEAQKASDEARQTAETAFIEEVSQGLAEVTGMVMDV